MFSVISVSSVIIVSSDKDMKTIPARIYNPDKDMPEVEIITKKQADYNLSLIHI